ncbi:MULTISPECIES: hypothetical protein [unclassified Micromonospora]|uniref:hypothetical protein n=1 Tax=unclassified Micromonospora TaxID=2617518 RepID=UPI0022B6DC65|nr:MULTISPECIES: hypothetical protein [unclassified Micromonospora]MCZ7417964.1 hypothetical protein [Verrucosispora sp. WMMA2121]MCZ7418001.1 hypothetical protein [Verrucosispora sp. WMMA2121]MCZ7419573.1 hypothetical protein [Verrucosispora sp. WMMA2121]MCZ7419592.1 hypothetical protein [Verrucosispora sp. WMMA2121]WBB89808.1 hypothetical protein O7597_22845 [Verrucosispora sp. WMMC514]
MTAIFNATGSVPLAQPRPAPETAQQPAPPLSVGPVLELPGTPPAALVPVTRDGRPVGVFVATAGRVRYRPLPDPDRLLVATAGVLAVGLVTAGVTVLGRRRPPAVARLTMGPGGWVSFRGVRAPAPRAARPWWARLLRARRLVAER